MRRERPRLKISKNDMRKDGLGDQTQNHQNNWYSNQVLHQKQELQPITKALCLRGRQIIEDHANTFD